MFKRPPVLYVLIAIVAIVLGLLVYLLDRRPEHVYFLSHGFALVHGQHSLFGIPGNSLPTFLHVYAFILLTAAVAGTTKARLIRICAAWFVVAALFEFAQLPAVSPVIVAVVPAWFAHVPILDNTAAYFLGGTFDVLDLLSIALGTVAAYFTVVLTRNRTDVRSSSKHRAWRYSALGGITVLGMLSIIGSGGGSSTPDTTPPTVSTTYPADAATGAFVDNAISVTFSEPMNASTINTGTFMLEDATHTAVLASVSYAGNTAMLTPINPLAKNTIYTATVTSGAKDLAGNALTADHSWSFTTETDAWQATATSGAPTARIKHAAVWTGSEMIVWGGQDSSGVVNSGGLYDPAANTWNTTTTSGAPTARLRHTSIWDDHDARMIVWGGQDSGGSGVNSGGLYDPAANTWSATTTSGAPTGRFDHTAVWTGSEMIVWGGQISGGVVNSGGLYDPAANTWSATTTSGAPTGRFDHTAVWTGSEMIVWGGADGLNYFNNGAAYDPATNTWRSIAAVPTGFFGRSNHTAVWTGTEMIVWGGFTNAGVTNSGAAYNPVTNTWRLISTTDAPAPRLDHTAVWTGSTGIAMVIWGGDDFSIAFNDGGRYDPVADSWKATDSTNNVPAGRFDHTAIWTGSEMIVWGGNDMTSNKTNTGGRYAP